MTVDDLVLRQQFTSEAIEGLLQGHRRQQVDPLAAADTRPFRKHPAAIAKLFIVGRIEIADGDGMNSHTGALHFLDDLIVLAIGEIAAVGVQFAEQHGKQRRLARAVGPHQAGFLARVEGERGVFEERFGAAREAELVKADHEEAG